MTGFNFGFTGDPAYDFAFSMVASPAIAIMIGMVVIKMFKGRY